MAVLAIGSFYLVLIKTNCGQLVMVCDRITERLSLEGISGGYVVQSICLDDIQAAFEYLQGCRFHDLSGQSVPVLNHIVPSVELFESVNHKNLLVRGTLVRKAVPG